SIASTQGIAAAEASIVEHFHEQTIDFGLLFMAGLTLFEPRMDLARKAQRDYEEGRYYACVPILLLLFDGFADDVGQENRGFFSQGVEMRDWDSITAHSRGLDVLSKLSSAKRAKTRTTPLTIPYRNGILHGHDLGFDNKIVAAKCWAALFAMRDWAV